jgi:hypothetical protein
MYIHAMILYQFSSLAGPRHYHVSQPRKGMWSEGSNLCPT